MISSSEFCPEAVYNLHIGVLKYSFSSLHRSLPLL